MRIQIKKTSARYNQIRIISTSSIATPLENFSLQFKDLSDSVTIRGDDLVEVSQGEAISLTDLFDNPVIEAGGSNQPASKEINVESENIDGIVQLRKSDEVIDQSSF